MNHSRECPGWAVALAGCLVGWSAGCGDSAGGSDLDEGPCISPNLGSVSLGEVFPPSEAVEPNPGNNSRSPVEWSVVLESNCDRSVEISETCVVGEEDDGSNQSDAEVFTKEGPRPEGPVETGEETVVRITYEREQPNSEGDTDKIAVVVQSNADNTPTLVVPICARVVGEDEERGPIECSSPVEIPDDGERIEGLCSG